MARTKQTEKRGWGGKLATFPQGAQMAPGLASAPGLESKALSGQAPRGKAPARQRVDRQTGKMPPTLHITHENATCWMTGANATPQRYYKPSEQQKALK